MAELTRFVEAQQDSVEQAHAELKAGEKLSHWMWFIFPQIAGLGRNPMARFYAIADLDEARAYLAHPVLGPRLVASAEAMLDWAGKHSAESVLGPIDALKLRSCMTLFERAASSSQQDEPVFRAVIDAFYQGERDSRTLALLGD